MSYMMSLLANVTRLSIAKATFLYLCIQFPLNIPATKHTPAKSAPQSVIVKYVLQWDMEQTAIFCFIKQTVT